MKNNSGNKGITLGLTKEERQAFDNYYCGKHSILFEKYLQRYTPTAKEE